MEPDTLLDDFILSLRIAMQGYKIAYCTQAYAIESGSADMREEQKRKVRIAAGGLQSIWRLRELLNPFRYGMLTFQYVSHRVLRWSLAPVLLFALLPLNIAILLAGPLSVTAPSWHSSSYSTSWEDGATTFYPASEKQAALHPVLFPIYEH